MMKKRFSLIAVLLVISLFLSSCATIPFVGDFIKSDKSLGKTNNTAVTIAEAMKDFLKSKKKDHFSLYEVELVLNSNGNGTVKLYYCGVRPEEAKYSDVYVAEVDSKTGHVQRFEHLEYEKDGLDPYKMIREKSAFDAGSLPIDSNAAITAGIKAFAADVDFHYDYIEMSLSVTDGIEQYDIRYISMLNDLIYTCRVDAVSGALLKSDKEPLK